ncbi:MAG: hypothetical protein AAB649_00305, partial [Patescibacteria group bacterium]
LGNIILQEGKDGYNPEQKYGEYVVLPLRWLGLSQMIDVPTLVTIIGFIGVFVLVLLIYALVFQLSRDKRVAILSALFIVLAGNMMTKYNFIEYFSIYGRPIYPLFSSLNFFLYLNLLVRSLKSDRRIYLLGAALLFGLSFYIYLFCWSFILVLNGVLAAIFLFRGERGQMKKILAISGIGLLLGSVELLLVYLYSQSDIGRQIVAFGGGAFSREFIFIKISWIALMLVCFYLSRNRRDENLPLLLGLILAGIISINQQIITGREFQAFHYFWNFIIPTVVIVGMYILWYFITSPILKRVFFYAVLVLIFANSITQAYLGTLSSFPVKNYAQNYRPVIDYVNRDTTPSVILASDPFYEMLFVVYTAHDLFWHGTILAFNTSSTTMRDAL